MQDLFVGVQSSYEDLYMTLVFLASLWLVGDVVCRRCLKIVPSLVGHIAVGIVFGPEGFDVVQPSPEQWVLLGNLGLLMLILQAGLEMDFQTLKLVGPRGVIIAIIGSILPISIGTGIAAIILRAPEENLDGSFNWKSALAAGCSFGPTSAGIAMNVLGQCQVLHTPVGQLVIAAAIVDDILALVILSQLRAFTSGPLASITDTIIPIASAFIWLLAGGSIALFIFPSMFEKFLSVFSPNKPSESQNARWTLSHTTLVC
jgi:Kef-type K+ transport system membrane component KefB